MKLSDAIMLGLLEGTRPTFMNINSCAFGLALNAEGVPRVPDEPDYTIKREFGPGNFRYQALFALWPWVLENLPSPLTLKMALSYKPEEHSLLQVTDYASLIIVWFDHYVMSMVFRRMTMDELVSVIRVMEPECGECCQRVCACERLAAERMLKRRQAEVKAEETVSQ